MRGPIPVMLILIFVLISNGISYGLQSIESSWTYNAVNEYYIETNIVYSSEDGFDCRLDVYTRKSSGRSNPTVICIHGGGWISGLKEEAIMEFLPYLEMGLSVVNVEYRPGGVALAPAAVEDCRMALRWVIKNAKEYGFDTSRIIVTGRSAGGHLALTTGMLDSSYGLDKPQDPEYANIEPRAAAIINWFGPTDLNDLVAGPKKEEYAGYWVGAECNIEYGVESMTRQMGFKYTPRIKRSKSEIESVVRAVSPVSYVRKDLPPIFTVHGDQDSLVPYEQAVKLHDALSMAGAPNQLMTIHGAGHNGWLFDKQFTEEDMANIYIAIKKFLKMHKIIE